MKEKDW